MKKSQQLLYFATGTLAGALIWNPPPVKAWELGSWVADTINGAYNALSTGKGQAQTPLPVPQMQLPIGNSGNSASSQPCAAPPTMAAAPEEVPASSAIKYYKDPKARVLMNTAPGNQMKSLINRVHQPDRYDGTYTYWQTDDGLIAVQSDAATDRFVSSWFVQ